MIDRTYTLAEAETVLNDERCVVLQQPAKGKSQRCFYVRKKAPQVVLRYCSFHDSALVMNCDFEYDQGSRIPKSWRMSSFDLNGALLRSVKTTVVDVAVGRPLDERLFDLQFPPGAAIHDRRKSAAQ